VAYAENQFVRERIIATLKRNQTILDGILHGLSQADATSSTDGPDGWTVLEVICHLRDLEKIYAGRITSMLTGENPTFPKVDPPALAKERNYAGDDLRTARATLLEYRRGTLTALAALTSEQWAMTGTHGVYGSQTVEVLAFQIVTHDLDHMEQITRILGRAERFA
jgi:uncharacterized damage-inducible protein DinB